MRFGSSTYRVLALVGLLAAPAEAATLDIDYAMTLAGLSIGTADLTGTLDDERYSLKLQAQFTGLIGVLTGGGRGAATATGTVSGSRLVPASFAATGRSASAERTLQIAMPSGNVTGVEIKPPFEDRPDRIRLSEADKRGVVDPLSALVGIPAHHGRPLDPANCNRTLPVFEGTQRFDIVLSFAGTRSVTKPGYTGEVLVCNARYVPIAGHRPQRPIVKFMTETRDIQVWLAPVDGGRVLAPLRISVPTMLGTTVIEAERWNVPAKDKPRTR